MINKLLILIISFSITSCSIIKQKRFNKEKSEVHHYHDSTFTIEKLTTKEIRTVGDSTKSYFDLEALLTSGYLKAKDGNFNTEIRYKDGTLEVTTIMDSILQRITELERTKGTVTTNKTVEIDSKTKTKDVEVRNYGPLIIGISLVLLLFIVLLAAIIYWKILKSRTA